MRLRAGLLWIAFAALVAYLSFVPFRFQPLGFEEALARFAQIRYLDLGAGNRADWVANILMFVPLGWLAAAFFVPHPRGRFDPAAVIPSLVLGAAWAVAVEFGQVYFAGRTVSINDIVAEVIGTFLGAWLWSAFGTRGREWWRTLLLGGRATANAALAGYLLAYLVLSFSPFDFIISADEFARKLASDLNGWWMAPVSCGRTPCSLKLLVEVLAVLPFGWWWAARRRDASGTVLSAAVLGASLGILIELAQLLLVSGTSQGASVLSRAAGVAAGAWLHSQRQYVVGIDWVRWGRPLVLAALLPYLAAVAYVAGWFGGRWLGLEGGLARTDEIRWMPFFYQYFSTEQALIRSTLVHLALYAPVGVAVWLWGRRTGSSSGGAAALIATALAITAETGKLFIDSKHPDYTDVLFAMAAAWAVATILHRISATTRGWLTPASVVAARADSIAGSGALVSSVAQVTKREPEAAAEAAVPSGPPASAAGAWPRRVAGAALLLLVALSVFRFPVWQAQLALGLAVYGWALARWPLAYLLVVPAALPLLDLAPLSGRLYWDEFDFLLATTLGIRLVLALPRPTVALRLPRAALSLLALSLMASVAVALWPPAPLDANAFAGYLSPYNALRVGKGYLWGGAMLWLLWRDAAAGRRVGPLLQLGLGLGLLAAVLGVFWERLLFVGMADFGAWFRAAGLVSATHIGGAYLEAILVVLTPFALAQAIAARRGVMAVVWFGVVLVGAAAVLMTLSRAAAAAWLISVATFGSLWWFGSRRPSVPRLQIAGRWMALAAMLVVISVAALLARSTFLLDRIAMSAADLPVRIAHWRLTVDLMRGEPLRFAFGTGLGSFPREFYLAQAAVEQLPALRLGAASGTGRTYVELYGGPGMYLDQRVGAVHGRTLRLSGDVRGSGDGAGLSVALCEKSFLTSVRCDWASVPAARDWQPFAVEIALPPPPAAGPRAPVSLSLHNGIAGTRIDVTGLSLHAASEELLANGSFAGGLDRWLMSSDQHLAWRAKNTPLQVLFEQGLLGVLAWFALGLAAVAAGARRIAEPPVAAAAAASIGFLAVGLFDTLLDSPRLTLLSALVLALLLLPSRER